MADLAHAERTLLIRRGKPGFPEGCHADVDAVLVRSNMMRRPHSYRFLDAKGAEITRGGLPLTDFDLEALFESGDPDAFVRDGRFERLLAALAREDAFVDRNARAAVADNRSAYARWRDAPWPDEVRALLKALLAHPKRRFTGWCPEMGRLTRARTGGWASPFYYQADAARELIQDGLLIGHLTRSDTYRFAPSNVAQLMLDGRSGVVTAWIEDGEIVGRTTLGALAFGAGLLTAFEARRVSWGALKHLAAAHRDRFCVAWYAPNADWKARSARHLLDFEGFDQAPSVSEVAGNWLASVSTRRLKPEAATLPEFDPAAIPSTNGRLVAAMVKAFWLGDEGGLDAALAAANGSSAEGLKAVVEALQAARGGDELGYLADTAERRAEHAARWRAAHGEPDVTVQAEANAALGPASAWASSVVDFDFNPEGGRTVHTFVALVGAAGPHLSALSPSEIDATFEVIGVWIGRDVPPSEARLVIEALRPFCAQLAELAEASSRAAFVHRVVCT